MNIRKTFTFLMLTVLVFVPIISGSAQDGQPIPQSPGGEELSIFLPVIVTPRVQSIFGVETYNFTSTNMQTALDADNYWIRSFLFDWSKIEAVRGVYDWTKVSDYNITQAAKYHMQIIANIKYTPSWAQKYSGVLCGPIKNTRLNDFGNFVKAMVTKYGAPPYNIRYWEFFNEPDVDRNLVSPDNLFGCWGEQTDDYYGGEYFSETLKVAYSAVKSVILHTRCLSGVCFLIATQANPFRLARQPANLQNSLRGSSATALEPTSISLASTATSTQRIITGRFGMRTSQIGMNAAVRSSGKSISCARK